MKEKFQNNQQLREMAEILASHWMTKPEIIRLFNFKTEREARRNIEKIANHYPVISTSTRAGYKVATNDDCTEMLKLADKELELKIKALQARREPLRAEIRRREMLGGQYEEKIHS